MSAPPTLWEEGREPAPQVVALGLAAILTVVALDLVLVGQLTLFFDLWFVVVSLALALAVRPGDFFTVGVLPPLLMLGVFTLLAFVSPGAVAESGDSVVQAVVSGLATHSGALLVGYVLCLVTLALRQRVARPAPGRGAAPQASKRAGSPAPRRTTTG